MVVHKGAWQLAAFGFRQPCANPRGAARGECRPPNCAGDLACIPSRVWRAQWCDRETRCAGTQGGAPAPLYIGYRM